MAKQLLKPAYMIDTEELVKEISSVLDIITKSAAQNKAQLEAEIESLRKALELVQSQLKQQNQNDVQGIKSNVEQRLNAALKTFRDELQTMHKEQTDGMKALFDKAASLRDGIDADEEHIIETATQNVLKALKAQPDEEEQLTIEDIEGLKEALDKLGKSSGGGIYHGGGSKRGQIVAYYLDDQLDGSTKTFMLPAFWKVISVQSSSSPNPMRETEDWTADGSNMSITFTSAIDETTTLSAGQRILILYAEA